MQSYDEQAFRARIDAALGHIRTVLDNTRNPRWPSDVPHQYEDKYRLTEFVTNMSIAALVQCFEALGLSAEQLGELRGWAATRAVTLRLSATEDCRFLREETRKVESPHAFVSEVRGASDRTISRTDKVVTTIVEYVWGFDFEWELSAFAGAKPESGIIISGRRGSVELRTGAKSPPRPQSVVRPSIDANVTWLLAALDAQGRAGFTIDRADARCHTPRRNREVHAALAAFSELYSWCGKVATYFLRDLIAVAPDHGGDMSALHSRDIFVPVMPLFEGGIDGAAPPPGTSVVPEDFHRSFLAEQKRTLQGKCRALSTVFPRDLSPVTAVEAAHIVTMFHAAEVCQQYSDSVTYVEEMLRHQLVDAIGKELSPRDFTAYMEFHSRKLMKPEYRPVPFSYSVRRPDHAPEGVLSVEPLGNDDVETISTIVRKSTATRPMSFALDASTRVSFLGERYLHGWVAHQFSGQAATSLELVARARQFSSFILLVGRIAGPDVFEPRHGIIIQNKDALRIPLMLEQVPSPKEFRDAIESLSPEQQRFARAFRGMQLESTLFGVCIIQIKPQLEKVLKLPADSLTKEIRMTQELLNLFMEYQIPSDLLSFDGPADAPAEEKLARVRDYVGRMREMIDVSNKRELEAEREREAMRLAEMNRSPFGPPGGGFGGGSDDGVRFTTMAGPPAGAFGPPPMPAPPGAGFGPPPMAPMPPPAMMAPAPAGYAMPSPTSAPAPQTLSKPIAHEATPSHAAPEARQAEQMETDSLDYTRIPADLDRKFEALDAEGALSSTIIKPGDSWSRSAQRGLLGTPEVSRLDAADQDEEKARAFDLLDALSRSGALPIEDASLHIVLASTHRFDRTLTATVIQQNKNPIEEVERSLLVLATTIHGCGPEELLLAPHRERLANVTTPKALPK